MKFKKFISIALCFILMIACVPIYAESTNEETNQSAVDQETNEPNSQASNEPIDEGVITAPLETVAVEMLTESEYYLRSIVSSSILEIAGNANNYVELYSFSGTNAQKWALENVYNDVYIIRSVHAPDMVLSANGNEVFAGDDDSVESALWKLENAYGYNGYTITNMDTGYSLYNEEGYLVLDYLALEGEDGYENFVWNFQLCSSYVNLTSITVPPTTWLPQGGTAFLTVQPTPSNATWSTFGFYEFRSGDSSVVTVAETGRITAQGVGSTYIKVTHIPTDIEYEFYISVGRVAQDGEYYFMNKSSAKYLEIEDPSMDEGLYTQVNELHNSTYGEWLLTYQANTGYYTIKSMYNNQYVGVKSSNPTENQYLVLYSTSSDATLWRIFKVSSGAYVFMPKLAESTQRCLAVPTGTVSNGTDCRLRQYIEDTQNQDEWYISRTDRRYSITVMMDNGYISRYGGVTSATNRINANLKKIKEKYAESFNVCFDFSTVSSFQSYADECCAYNVDCDCISDDKLCNNSSSSSLQNYHHTNTFNILYRLPNKEQNDLGILTFVGHETCRSSFEEISGVSQKNHKNGPYGIVDTLQKKMMITNFENKNRESKTTSHEIGHLFGAIDHYGGGEISTLEANFIYETNLFNSYCIYGEDKESANVCNGQIICEGCKAMINDYFN